MTPRTPTVSCPKCGQLGNQPPGLKLGEYETLSAVFVMNNSLTDTTPIPGLTPQRLTCRSCGASWPVIRGSIDVIKP